MSWAQEAEVREEASQKIRVANANFQTFAISLLFFWNGKLSVWWAAILNAAGCICDSIKLFRPEKSPGLQSRDGRSPNWGLRQPWIARETFPGGVAFVRNPRRPRSGRLSRFLPRERIWGVVVEERSPRSHSKAPRPSAGRSQESGRPGAEPSWLLAGRGSAVHLSPSHEVIFCFLILPRVGTP